MNRTEVIEFFGTLRDNAAVVSSPGLANYQIAEHADHVLTLFAMEMAYVSSTALGVALGWPGHRERSERSADSRRAAGRAM